jgi:hypothetical protein
MHNYILSGSGQQNVLPGAGYRVNVYAIENSLVAAWDMQAGLAGADTIEMRGGYAFCFFSAVDESMPVAGAQLTLNGSPNPMNTFYFSGARTTIGKSMQTDATGCGVQQVKTILGTYSGMGGGVSAWEQPLGTSVPNVIFVQKFHPMM